jgi:hypothetical protein
MMAQIRWSLESVLKIDPADIPWKLTKDTKINGILGGDWDIKRRVPFESQNKYRAVHDHFVLGVPWQETLLFTFNYADRFRNGETVRGARNMKELVAQYDTKVRALYGSLKARGFASGYDVPHVHIASDGAVMLGNNGVHRVSMAKILKLPFVYVWIRTIHKDVSDGRS